MKKRHALMIAAGLTLAFSSCKTHQTTLPYFTDIIEVPAGEIPGSDYMTAIQPDDELLITVQSKDPLATAAYNQPLLNAAKNDELLQQTSPRVQTYTVSSTGDIMMPVLGSIHVAGMTTEELQKLLTEKISADVKDPLVNVTRVNFTVIVAGEVKAPQRIAVSNNRITLLDALAMAGDLTEFGERSNILIIREEDGKRVYGHVDLNSSETLTSPYYYLQPKDYVYVAPNKIRQANSKYNQNNAFKLSVISTIVSGCSVIVSLIIALTTR